MIYISFILFRYLSLLYIKQKIGTLLMVKVKITEELNKLITNMLRSELYSHKQIAETLGISTKTVQRTARLLESGRQFKTASGKLKENWANRNSTFSELETKIMTLLQADNSLIQSEIQEIVQNTLNLDISQSTVSRKIKKIQFSRKKCDLIPIERNTVERIRSRFIYASSVSRISNEHLIFLDETGFNAHTQRRMGYAPRNIRASTVVPGNKGANRSLICAIGVDGVVAYTYRTGAFNSNSFIDFINNKLAPYFELNSNKILVMDNARIHHSAIVVELLRRKGIPVQFLVPYTPELNPIEQFFSMIKNRFRTIRRSNNNSSIESAIDMVFQNQTFQSECQGFYRHMRMWIEKALRNEIFN